jgi:hypothetical protein
MPTIRTALIAMTAGQTGLSIFAGSQYEYLPFHAKVEVAVIADAAGVTMQAYLGSDVLQQGGSVTQKAAPINPVYPDDYHLVDVGRAGERLTVLLSATGIANIQGAAILTPL